MSNCEVLIDKDNVPYRNPQCGCICGLWLPKRYCLVLMLFWGIFNIYAMRSDLSVAIEPMSCQFNWNSSTEGYVLSAFFIGYLFGNIPGGILAERYGGKLIFGIGSLATVILTIIIPFATSGSFSHNDTLTCYCNPSSEYNQHGWCFNHGQFTNDDGICKDISDKCEICDEASYVWILITLRFFMGMFESVTFPAMYSLLNRWMIPTERSKMIGISSAGVFFGNAVAFPISSFIIASNNKYFGGWPVLFYFFSILGIIWYILWIFTVSDSPSNDRCISAEEKQYIETQLPPTIQHRHKPKIPWKTLLTHPIAVVMYYTHFTNNWAFYTLLTELPTYLNDELDYDLSSAGIISVTPYIGQFLFCSLGGIVTDILIKRKILTVGLARKLLQLIAEIIPSTVLIICGYLNDPTIIVILLSLSTPLMGLGIIGVSANYSDISPTLSSIMYGIGNTISTFAGFVSPILSGWILNAKNKKEGWIIIFYISFFIIAVGEGLFWKFGTGQEIPELNVDTDEENKEQNDGHVSDYNVPNVNVNASINTKM